MTDENASRITDFGDLLHRAGASKHPRQPGQWTGVACTVWREAGEEWSRVLEAALAWELTTSRLARPEDEPAVRNRLAEMQEATGRIQAARMNE